MPYIVDSSENRRPSERRLHPRKQLWFPSIQLGADNGGIILDISESGLAIQAVKSLADGQLPAMRFQLSESQPWIEIGGRIAWIGASSKMAGVEFVGLPEEARDQIRQWIPLRLRPTVPVEENLLDKESERVKDALPTAEPKSLIFVPESETKGRVDENQGRHSIVEDPAEVLPSTAEAQDAETVSWHIGDKSTKAAVTANARPKTSPALFLSYEETTSSREISDRRRTTGSGKSRGRTGLFVTAVLLLSGFFLLASRFQGTGNGSQGTEVKAAAKVGELSSDRSANPKTLSGNLSLSLDRRGFVLQVGAMTHEENADALAESLRQKNFPALVARSEASRFYRVVVGPFNDRHSTLRVKEQLKKLGFDAFRTPWNPSDQ